MSISPIRFHTAQDYINFIDQLESLGFIKRVNEQGRQQLWVTDVNKVNKRYIKSTDLNIYLFDDVQQYLKDPAVDIQQPSCTFLASDSRPVTLTELKANPAIELKFNLDIFHFVQRYNSALFYLPSLSPLNTMEEINTIKTLYDNNRFYSDMKLSISLLKISNIFWDMAKSITSPSAVIKTLEPVKKLQPATVMNPLQKDFYTISLIQQVKLKTYLLNEMSRLKGKEEKAVIAEWIKNIEEGIENTKQVFELVISNLESQNSINLRAKSAYEAFLKAYPNKEDVDKELNLLNNENEQLKNKIKFREESSLFKALKISVYALLIGIPLLSIVVALGGIALLSVPAFLATIGFTMISVLGVTIGLLFSESFGDVLVNPVLRITDRIKTAVDSLFSLEKLLNKLNEVDNKINDLISCIKFTHMIPDVKASIVEHEQSISEVKSALQEMRAVEKEDRAKIIVENKAASASSPSISGMFNHGKNAPLSGAAKEPSVDGAKEPSVDGAAMSASVS